MFIARALTFLLFLLLALGMAAWQVQNILADVARAGTFEASMFILALGPLLLAGQAIGWRLLRGKEGLGPSLALAGAGVLALPLTAFIAGVLSLIMARGGNHRRIWDAALAVGALLGLNVLACVGLGFLWFQGQQGLSLGVSCVKVQFFLVVDYFLLRAIWHYFGSAASTFISLRYLRRRVISLLSVGGVAVGVMVLIVVNSIMSGFQADFREQIRGSSSHLLVRFDSDQFHPRGAVAQTLEWAEYVRLIESEPEIKAAWETELANASRRAVEAGADGDALLERLRSGRGITTGDLRFLRDGPDPTMASRFYLVRKIPGTTEAAQKARDALDEEARQRWFYPEFRRRMQEAFDGTETVLKAHRDPKGEPDVVGVSWRVSVKTVITPRNRTTELPLAELTGVDLSRETTISSLGRYVGAAETQYFKVRFILHPLQQVLGGLIGFETPASKEALAASSDFRYTPTGAAQDRGDLATLPYDMRRILRQRRLSTTSDKIAWDNFDDVRFYNFTPAAKIYEVAKEAYKRALRTQDLEELKAIAADTHRALRALLDAELARPAGATDEEAMARMGCRILLEHYLTGVHQSHRRMLDLVSRYVDRLATMARNEDIVPPEEKAWFLKVWEAMREATEARRQKIVSLDISESEREQALLELVLTYVKIVKDAIARGRAEGYVSADELRDAFTLDEEHARSELPFAEESGLFPARPLPLAYAVEQLDRRMALVRKRQEAYEKVLPLRASMGDRESIEDYARRAAKPGQRPSPGDLPGIILGEALAESPWMGGIMVGDTVALTIPRIYRDEDGRLVPRAVEAKFRVTGFFRSGLYEENLSRLYCDFDELAKLMADSDVRYIVGAKFRDYTPYEGEINNLRLKQDVGDALRAGGVLPATAPGVWEDEKRSLLEAVNREKMILSLIIGFILVLAGALIVIVVYQLVSEKVKDIGILKALGHSPWGIRSVFMFNALFIGLFGAALGSGAGVLISQYLNEIEDFIDRMTGIRLFPPDVYFLTYIPSVKGADLALLAINIAVPAVLWSFACGILPALAAARKDPVEALHNE